MIIKFDVQRPRRAAGMTIVEGVVAMAIAGVAIAALVGGFVGLSRSAQTCAYSLAANARAIEGYEQVRAAKWDALSDPPEDEVVSSNFPPRGVVLDIPGVGTNVLWATNYTTITTVSINPLLKVVRVDCAYPSQRGGYLTNSILAYRATETGQQNSQEAAAPASPTTPPAAGTITETNSRTTYTYVAPTNDTSGSWASGGTSSGTYGGGSRGTTSGSSSSSGNPYSYSRSRSTRRW